MKNININSTLVDYGLDSMAIVELAQTFEREFDVFFTPQDLKTMTFAKLYEMQESVSQGKGEKLLILFLLQVYECGGNLKF